jgi:hypothetical protein
MVAASAKSAKSVSTSKCVSYYKSDNEEDKKMLPLSPTGKPAYGSPIRKGFSKALEDYKNNLKSSDAPSKPKKLDSALDEYKEAQNKGTFQKKHLDKVLSKYCGPQEDISVGATKPSPKK